MGNGASANPAFSDLSQLQSAVDSASSDDLKNVLSGLSAAAKQKIKEGLSAPLKPEDQLEALKGPAKAEVAAMGSMSDAEVAHWFVNSDMMKRVQAKTGMTLEDILNGPKCAHPIGKKLVDGTPLDITIGCSAPDGLVYGLDGETTSTLHASIKEHKDTPMTLLIFGSQTCPMFMGKLKPVCEIIRPHIAAARLGALLVYIREAHPTDGWANGADSPFPKIKQTHTMPDRIAAAKSFAESAKDLLGPSIPIWVDDATTNALDVAYEAPPARLVLVDPDLKVVFATGQAPLQYDLGAFSAFLNTTLGEP